MTPKKEPKEKTKTEELKTYVEIGPNLRFVLEKMLSKIEPSGSSTYLNVSFAPICYMIDNFIDRKQNKEDSLL